jgi:hypothetical protein
MWPVSVLGAKGSGRACSVCATRYDEASWNQLAFVERVDRMDATDVFSEWPWPRDAVLEVRRCTCGEAVSRVIEPRGPRGARSWSPTIANRPAR